LHHRGRQAPTKAVCASRLVTAHWLALCAGLDAADRPLPAFVGQEFDAFLTCGILAHGALRVRCDACQLDPLLATLTKRIARHLVRRGWLAEDAEGAALTGEDLGDSGLGQLRAHYHYLPDRSGLLRRSQGADAADLAGRDPDEPPAGLLAKADGFSLHAGVTVGARDSARRERLCRYLARPPVAHDRLSLTHDGRVAYALTSRQDCRLARPQAARRAGPRDVPGEHAVPGRDDARGPGAHRLHRPAWRRWCRARGPT
jgi:hypothetical protein